MIEEDISAIATRLRDAERTGKPIEPFGAELSIRDAYAIQRANTRVWLDEGRTPVGRKIGLTSAVMQKQLGVSEPDHGVLFEDMLFDSGAEVSANRFILPRIEPEVGIVLEYEVGGASVNELDVWQATKGFVPTLEIIDSRVSDWRITIADTIADNASSGAVVVGSSITAKEAVDPACIGCNLGINGRLTATGSGAAVMGSPLKAVAWLARTLHELGEGLAANSLILPGSMTAAAPCAPGDVVAADMGAIGVVTVNFAKGQS